jgi:hypothetical protein
MAVPLRVLEGGRSPRTEPHLGVAMPRSLLQNIMYAKRTVGTVFRRKTHEKGFDISKKVTIPTKNVSLWESGCTHRKTDWTFEILVEFHFRSAEI